jgi:hypothetical protein
LDLAVISVALASCALRAHSSAFNGHAFGSLRSSLFRHRSHGSEGGVLGGRLETAQKLVGALEEAGVEFTLRGVTLKE